MTIWAKVPSPWRLPLATYLICQTIYGLWWAAFYPGLMNADSINFILHVTTGPWINNHSVLYDALIWLSLHTTGDVAAVTLAQTTAMSAALAYTVAAFRRLGVPGRWTAIAAVIVAALPPQGTFIVFLWKDVPFSICGYLTVPTLAHLLSLRGRPGSRPPGWRHDRQESKLIAALGLELLGMSLFRQDGFLMVALAAAGMVLLIAGIRIRLAVIGAGAVCLTLVLNLYVFPAVGIRRANSSLILAEAYSDIAVAYTEAPRTFTAADTKLMARVVPLAEWKSGTCYSSNSITFIRGFYPNSQKLSHPLFRLWLRVLNRSPELIIHARICRGSIAWLVFPGTAIAQTWDYLPGIPSNLWGWEWAVRHNPYRAEMTSRPLFGNGAAVFLRSATQAPELDWLLWRGSTWTYVTYVAVAAFALRRKDRPLLAMAAVAAGQQLTVLAQNPIQAFRYMATPLLIGVMLVPLFCARNRRPERADAREPADTSDGMTAFNGAATAGDALNATS